MRRVRARRLRAPMAVVRLRERRREREGAAGWDWLRARPGPSRVSVCDGCWVVEWLWVSPSQ
jgi:hypothetical protein